jgi:SAM-dependent methyltransferase
MPVSNPEHIPVVLHFVQAVQPRSVLDVGVGTGSYGLLLRQGLDIGHGRVRPEEWQVNIEGAEIFEGYRNPVWAYAYNRIHLGDIRQLLPTLPAFDLILCNDVLEHFAVDEARQLVRDFLNRGSVLVATTPNIDYPQGAWGGNEAERHHCLLRAADFHGLVAEIKTGITSCFVATNREDLVYPLLLAADRSPRVTPGRPMHPWVRLRRKWREWRLTRKS